MKLRNILTVYRKELRDLLRDRRTLFGMLVFPLVLFPLLTVGFGEVQKKAIRSAQKKSVKVMLLGEENAPGLAARLRESDGLEVVPATGDYVQQINEKKLQAAVEFPPGFEQKATTGTETPRLAIYDYTAELRSEAAADRIDEVASKYRDQVVVERLGAKGLTKELLDPVQTRAVNVATAEKVGGNKMGQLLPYFIIVLCLMGGLHAAIDLTAGEKERGTMETILASPVGRGELVLGKFLMVLTSSLWSAGLSIASYVVTLRFAPAYAEEFTRGQAYTISLQAIALIFLMVLPLAVLFSAGLLTLALQAKSYKEAQSYTGYLMIAAILPAIISILPGVDLNAKLALVPIVNVSLATRELFTGSFPWRLIALVFASTTAYAAAALWLAVKMFQRESVLFRT